MAYKCYNLHVEIINTKTKGINKMKIDRLENIDEVNGFEKALMMIAGKGLLAALNFKNAELERIDNELAAEMERMAREHKDQFKEWRF